MARSKYRDAEDMPRTISSGVLDALGRGFLICSASVMAGLWFGTVNMATGMWAIGLVAAGGIACMVGSAMVKHAWCGHSERKTGGSPHAAKIGRGTPPVAAVEPAQETAPEEYRARRSVVDGRRREHGAGTGRGG
jgi:hypothetical protein